MEDQLTLHPSRSRALMLIGLGALFVLLGILLLDSSPVVGTGGVVVGTLVLVAGIWNLLSTRDGLVLDRHGFTLRSMGREETVAWDEVVRFGPWPQGRTSLLGYELTAEARARRGRRNRALNVAAVRLDAPLPELYGKQVTELGSLMTAWKQRHDQDHA
ncbi:hypothetical protein [Nocardioides bruguierae]|uniref:PH domain-containing protein n=1 Tax=Nocardioides bruguierae TaxID=2945102 RepID=A0A9X2IFD7_9ACTN|nr:hypothetical protein [Nocardioides bruguierae]MCM0620319.1 hypothetical protein [Nocardioides bruguierae]